MISHSTARCALAGLTRGACAVVMVAVAACSTTEFLQVSDADIINPADVQSAPGANAVRLGALARFNSATSGEESLFALGGLFADEWVNGDSFIERQQIDNRVITIQNGFLTTANRVLHRSRLAATQAIQLLRQFNPTGPTADVAEMYFVQAYVENLMAENYCSGIVFSTVVDGVEQYGTQSTTSDAYNRALAHADSALALITGSSTADVKIRNALTVTKGRILLNLNKPTEAAAAVAAVPTSFRYDQLHAITTTSNVYWNFNNLNRRYSVSASEGTNGLNFATAADPRLPVCLGGDAACVAIGVTQSRRDDNTSAPLHVQRVWPARESPVTVVGGIEARMIEAESQLRAGNAAAALVILNTARGTVTALTPLADAGTAAGRIDQLFRERAFWMFGTGHRVGDLRRLIRQHGRAPESVFPTGAWHKGGNYGTDVTIPVPQAEENNPNVPIGKTCIDRVA